ncbi:UDP-N-acetylmuramoyl-tripeptide--D-alanyl-D-alanineligase [Candidatus Providencia siddallii]|uniref:UDP-N-acetylmuramoyl-tripeptide--D-alanyl-D-alanine ligase n=1 Tax=Candidatus Providencia siddallii TaxID=1715285 RepID=A0A0M6W6G9_9GAMM|nr:UDP-N-acetylmuramoyl-tripeptide--D-alanyl-D-alanineligase [Candidatus Providencia siddallii]
MIPITLTKLAKITKGYIRNTVKTELFIESISINSNKIERNSLFIALKGNRFDAHEFVFKAVNNGAKALLLERQIDINCPQIIVKNTRHAIGNLATWVCQQSNVCVIGLTGSSGKTSVKEMTASILSRYNNTLYTIGNLNNDIGVSITLFRLTTKYKFAVIEIGANNQGEIKYITNIIKPKIALVNNLFDAHLTGFGTKNKLAKEKGEIYQGLSDTGTAIVNIDSFSKKWIFKQNQTILYYSLTKNQKVDFYPTDIKLKKLTTNFILHTPIGYTKIILHLPGIHNISNALAASALSFSVGATLEHIKNGLSKIQPMIGRLYPIFLDKNKILLDDTYNSNVGSMIAAINTLTSLPGHRVLVISDMLELGDHSCKLHRKIALIAKKEKINKILSIGKFNEIVSKYNDNWEHFNCKKKLLIKLICLIENNDVISVLVKGSRISVMENIIESLKEYFKC